MQSWHGTHASWWLHNGINMLLVNAIDMQTKWCKRSTPAIVEHKCGDVVALHMKIYIFDIHMSRVLQHAELNIIQPHVHATTYCHDIHKL